MTQLSLQQLLDAAKQHHRASRLREAEQCYRQVLSIDPRCADALHLLGMIAYQVGEHPTAADLIARAIGLRGSVAEYHNNFGLVLIAQRRFDQAISPLQTAIRLKGDFVEAHIN